MVVKAVKAGGPREYHVAVRSGSRKLTYKKWARSKVEAVAKAVNATSFSEVRARDLPKRTTRAIVSDEEFLVVTKTDDLTGNRGCLIARRA